LALYTDIPTRAELGNLLEARDPVSVSIYLPTSVVTQEARADRIELKTLASDALGQLERAGAERRAVGHVRDALDDVIDDEGFWMEQAHSLAVFASPQTLRTFRLPNRLTAVVEVGDRFYVKPLLRAVTFPQAAFVLALAAGSVRLIQLTREGPPSDVAVPGLPTDAASAAGKASIADRSPSRRIQGSEGQKVRLRQFARKVDHALRGVLSGSELPLILAATEPLESIYRSVNRYPHLAEPGIHGSPEHASDAELADAARTLLDGLYERELSGLRDRFQVRFDQGRASTDVATVARAATYGAVDTVFVDIDQKLPGFVDEDSGAVTLSDDDAASYGVVDEIVRRVLRSDGRVFAVRAPDMPGGGAVAAILRYPL
jgi:hypothetical protein